MIQNNQFIGLRNANNILKAFQRDEIQLPSIDELQKGGEGSKGGKVIGHTRGGKPIYVNPSHKDHVDFTNVDHRQASNLHTKLADRAFQNKETMKYVNHMRAAEFHSKAAKHAE